jgi:hypothetical protein
MPLCYPWFNIADKKMVQANKRSTIPVIDRAFQFKYTGMIVLTVVLISASLGYLLLLSYWEMNRIMDVALASFPGMGEKVNESAALDVFYISISFLVLEVLALGTMGLIITHRVCGPIFVLHGHLLAMLDGKYPVTRRLRPKDEFRATFELFTAVVESLRKRDADELEKLDQAIVAARQKGVQESDLAPLERLAAERRARIEK